ncbi:MAG: hypothetical protein U0487_01580 [Patescibacteria group bacterium]
MKPLRSGVLTVGAVMVVSALTGDQSMNKRMLVSGFGEAFRGTFLLHSSVTNETRMVLYGFMSGTQKSMNSFVSCSFNPYLASVFCKKVSTSLPLTI